MPSYEPGTCRRLRGDHRLPEVLTVDEAAEIVRIGRRLAYEQARLWRETAGREGLPVLVIGRCLRVPRAALEDLLALKTALSAEDATVYRLRRVRS